jgi:hypothetical protein
LEGTFLKLDFAIGPEEFAGAKIRRKLREQNKGGGDTRGHHTTN